MAGSILLKGTNTLESIKIKRLHPDAVLPVRAHSTDAGLDLHASEDVCIPVLRCNLVPSGMAAQSPNGYGSYITPRTGLAASHGRTVLNAPGTIDAGFTGEIKVILVNHGQAPYLIQPGERIAQLVIHKIELPWVQEVNELPTSERGANGFGSTGQ